MNSLNLRFLVCMALLLTRLYSVAAQQSNTKAATSHPTSPIAQPALALPPNTALLELRDDKTCVQLFAGMSGGPGLEKRMTGKRPNVKAHFYFHGSEVVTFPGAVEVLINLFAACKNSHPNISFVWPDFSRHLHFIFHWNSESANGTVRSNQEVQPSSTSSQDSIWKEDSSAKEFRFTLPARGISVTAQLTIDIFSGDRLMETIVLHL